MTELITEPGYVTEFTDRGSKGRWVDGDNTRFRNGLPQKIGGSQKLSTTTFLGTCRKIKAFKSSDLDKYLALATHLRFYVLDGTELVNVTPLRVASSTLTNPFSTTAASTSVTVNDVAHGCLAGDYVTFEGATASPIDGILIDGDYEVQSVTDADNYVIEISTTATNSEAGFGGTVTYYYEISAGLKDSLVGTGWGALTWGLSTWGTPRSSSGINLPLRLISIDEWGEDVIWNIRKSAIYVFDTSAGIASSNRATEITQAPDTAEAIIVSPEDRFLIALGAYDGANDDPMLVAWCDQEDYTVWTPSATNQAGDKRLDAGTRLMAGVFVRGQILILSDTAAYSMQYIGYPEVFSFRHLASECGLIAPNALVSEGERAFWSSKKDFWLYDGVVRRLPCAIRNHIYQNLNLTQQEKMHVQLVNEFNEIWILYPRASSIEIDAWAVYNHAENFFFFGTFDDWDTPRTAWLDDLEYSDNPVSAGEDGYLWTQEVGTDSGENALPSRIVRFADEVAEGDRILFMKGLIPDFREIIGSVQITVEGKRYPQDTETYTKGPYTFTGSTSKRNIRMRARQIKMTIASSDQGDHWEFGTMRRRDTVLGAK